MTPYFNKGTPLTIAMWDFSWLQAHHPGGAFGHLERCVMEAVDRGYNMLRVDVFPHFYLEGESTLKERGGQRSVMSWGFTRVSGGPTLPCGQRFAVICTDAHGPCNHPDLPEVLSLW